MFRHGCAPPSGAGARLLLSYAAFISLAGGSCNKPFSTLLFDKKKGRRLIIMLGYRTTKHRAVLAYCLDRLPVQTRILLLWLPRTDLTEESHMLQTYAAYYLSYYLKAE